MKKLLIIAILYSPSAFAATIYPPDASPNAIAVDRQIKAEMLRSPCMFSENGKCSLQSLYNGGGDGGGGGAGAGGASGSSGSGSGSGSSGGGTGGTGGTGGCK